MIDELVKDLKREEGFVPYAYQDHLKFWTIGYGFLIDEKKGGRIPEHIAEAWLEWLVEDRWRQLASSAPWIKDQPEDVQRALCNMAYQMGVSGVLRFRNMVKALRAGDRKGAAKHALDSTWARQTPARAARVAALIAGEADLQNRDEIPRNGS